MRLVARWALTKGGAEDAEHILRAHGAPDWAAALSQLRGAAEKTNATNEMVLGQTLGFMEDPALAEAALPGPGELDITEFLASNGTLYLIADPSGNDESLLSPYFAALAGEIRYAAGMIGQASASGRLDPPLLMALDECTQICRCPVDSWLADSGGKGVQIATVVHGEAQLAKTWDDTGARIILDTSGCKVVLPGVDDPATLDRLSKICGDHSYRVHGQDGSLWQQHPRMSPSMINQLPDGFALIKRGNCPPVVAKVAAVRKDREVRRAVKGGYAVAELVSLAEAAAIEAVAFAVPAGPDEDLGMAVAGIPDDTSGLDATEPAAYPWSGGGAR